LYCWFIINQTYNETGCEEAQATSTPTMLAPCVAVLFCNHY
jgi:hypothetical protein